MSVQPTTTPDDDERSEDDAPKSAKSEKVDAPTKTAKEPLTIWQRATYRWTAITAVMAAMLILYTQHPYYEGGQFQQWRSVFPVAFMGWLVFGLFYCKATLEKFHQRRYVMRDGGLHLVMLGKVGFKDALSRTQWYVVGLLGLTAGSLVVAQKVIPKGSPSYETVHNRWVMVVTIACALVTAVLLAQCIQGREIWRKVRNPRVRTTLLGICVKGFFTPLMTGFVSGHITSVLKALATHHHVAPLDFKPAVGTTLFAQAKLWWLQVGSRLPEVLPTRTDVSNIFTTPWSRDDVGFALGLAYDLVFVVDCGWALAGYASESRWLGNKTRSVEPTALGWVACIFCYPPFNGVLGTYLPLENGPAHFGDPVTLLWFKAFTVLLFSIYSAATVAFGWKFSNLTNRGIVTRGPYAFIRHPAYVCKCSAWWLEHIPTMTLTKAFFLTLLCGVYALRAWTEERHLSKDPDYRAYKKKTPWVIIPGVY